MVCVVHTDSLTVGLSLVVWKLKCVKNSHTNFTSSPSDDNSSKTLFVEKWTETK